ncbi:pyridine nucleotide-disulfide oxidoreductase family protein, partial [Colletotrichum scovillei]
YSSALLPHQEESLNDFCTTFAKNPDPLSLVPQIVLDACHADEVEHVNSEILRACSCVTQRPAVPTLRESSTACSVVSATWVTQISTTSRPTIDAKLAYDCITSVPLNKSGALKFVDELVPYLEWQSNLAFIKEPPPEYFFPPHDVFDALDNIRQRLEADEYLNEYSWQHDLFVEVLSAAHDGHLYVNPDVLTNAMEWARPFPIISISEDGFSAPVIKIYDDFASSPSTASAVSLINGVDASTFIQSHIFDVTANQDAESAYNSMFWSKALAAVNSVGSFQQGGRTRYIYPGETTTFTFENGTVLELRNIARLKGDLNGVYDGRTFFERFAPGALSPPATTSSTSKTVVSSARSTSLPSSSPTTVKGYPKPIISSKDSIVSGYYIDEAGFEDVAVLVMLSFGPKSPAEFQSVVEAFFVAAVSDGKTKLVVDLQVNNGGYIFQGYDTFRQIFPDIVQEGTGRWRYSSGFAAVSQAISEICNGYDPNTATEKLIQQCESVFNWRHDLNRHLETFISYEDKFVTKEQRSDNFTNLLQWDFDNPLSTVNDTFGIGYQITGYGERKNVTRPFGGPENIVLLFDGVCASTCSLFSQFMKWDAGVQSIALGGRPETKSTIQGVGGVKGSQAYSFKSVFAYAQIAKDATNDSTLLAELNRLTTYVESRASSTSINVKDEILRQNWEDGMPAQFVAENADCRLYWQAEMHQDVRSIWKAAATAAFKGGRCAFGAIKNKVAMEKSDEIRQGPLRLRHPRSPMARTLRYSQVAELNAEALRSWTFQANHFMSAEN